MTTNKRRLRVFLCHADADIQFIRIYYDRLRNDGLDVWMAKAKLIPGQDREHEVRKALEGSDIIIVCHSKQFNQDGFHQKVVKLAIEASTSRSEGQVFIIPARLENCDVLQNLKRLESVDLFENLPIATAEDGYQYLLRGLRQHAHDFGAILQKKRRRLSKISSLRLNSRGPVPQDVLRNWLIRHGITVNPFRHIDPVGYPSYPEGTIRPDQWEFLLDPIPLLAHCPTAEDAQVLTYVLRKECLPLENENSLAETNRHIFPLWVWLQQTTPVQLLATFAHSAVRTWLNILPKHPHILLNLSLAEQNSLLDLFHWSLGSKKALINLIQLNVGLSENENTQILIRKIAEFEGNYPLTAIPQDEILLSWLEIRPIGTEQTCLILPGDDLLRMIDARRLEQFDSLISTLFRYRIVTKMFVSSSLSSPLSLQEMELSWSERWLSRSLDSQFDAAMHPEEKSIGKSIRFHELFGPDATEEATTERLISASQRSMARMLLLGNRLFQNHCWRKISETYLSLEELDDILKLT